MYRFNTQFILSQNTAFIHAARAYLSDTLFTNPAMIIQHHGDSADRVGGDFEVQTGAGPIFIDYKLREFDPIERFRSDDICVELVSAWRGNPNPPYPVAAVEESPGWTLDPTKRSDYILYAWSKSNGTFRVWLVDFKALRLEAMARWREWSRRYGVAAVRNRNYHTLCTFVPRYDIHAPAFPEATLNPFTEEVSQ